MAGENQDGRVVNIRRIQKSIICHNCKNDNLIHGLTLAKADSQSLFGGPGQLPNLINEKWAIYLCINCGAFYPYPKKYPGQPHLKVLYQQIFDWCDQKAKQLKLEIEAREKLLSVIEANRDLIGLPGGVTKAEEVDRTLQPLQDQIDEIRREVFRKRGGRPRHCSSKNCKNKAEIDGLCREHFKDRNM